MRPPFSVVQGVLLEQPVSEIWARTGDSVRHVSDQILTALTGEKNLPYIDIATIGAGALNQAVKGMASARQRLLQSGTDLTATPFYSVVSDDTGSEKTRLVFRVEIIELP